MTAAKKTDELSVAIAETLDALAKLVAYTAPPPPEYSALHGASEIPLGMSNLCHDIDDGLDAALRANPEKFFGRHAAVNFNGLVWFKDGRFHEEVWRYHEIVKIVSADSLEDLMTAVNDEFGYE